MKRQTFVTRLMTLLPLLIALPVLGCDRSGPTASPESSPPKVSEVTSDPSGVTSAAAPQGQSAAPTPPARPVTKPSPLAAGIIKKQLRFKKGETSATMEDAVVRGEQHWYEFGANAGQSMDVSITSVEDNAVFGLYVVSPYGWQDRINPEGNVAFADIENDPKGKPAGVDIERTKWLGQLPEGSKTGKSSVYAILVGGTRGKATYTLKVTIAAEGCPKDRKCDALYGGTDCLIFCSSDADCSKCAYGIGKCVFNAELHPTQKTCGVRP